MALLDDTKLALRITGTAYDNEVTRLINAACQDLSVSAGVANAQSSTNDELLKMAIITYVRLHFGSPDDYERLERFYDSQKAQLQAASGYGLQV